MQPDSERPDRAKVGAPSFQLVGRDNSVPDTDARPTAPTPAEQAEAALLGSMMLAIEARNGAPRQVGPDDFSREAHRTLFAAVVAMVADGVPVDPVTVNDRLVATNRLAEVGGATAVHRLSSIDGCPTPSSWPAYATIVAREGRRRRGIERLQRAIERLEAGEDPATVATWLGGVA